MHTGGLLVRWRARRFRRLRAVLHGHFNLVPHLDCRCSLRALSAGIRAAPSGTELHEYIDDLLARGRARGFGFARAVCRGHSRLSTPCWWYVRLPPHGHVVRVHAPGGACGTYGCLCVLTVPAYAPECSTCPQMAMARRIGDGDATALSVLFCFLTLSFSR